ncbi:glycosyltransferase family 2 protein [Flavobacterium covae]|uniref:glycosyltransferase family 2 protein n=1 Tax=Flavobacterium covae TaxID=2906076 RepID=UPI000745E4BC|nr:hypothetical protein [Flavobacterium covae]AMA49815.1 hypothetical protein AWN65_10320 [Flavobacterium covae]MCJ1809825.1 glycosyltransferase family 2 protein [Flavobacterium covae]
MEFSYLIVTHNRTDDLSKTLLILKQAIDLKNDEVLVYIDACPETETLKEEFSWVKWYSGKTRISASPARAFLYPHAMGKYLIGLDDDAHLISTNYKEQIRTLFTTSVIGILAFKEVKGIFKTDQAALDSYQEPVQWYETNEFIGCGFAIKKSVYEKTKGFPVWIDIYGEETCLSLEVLNLGYEIWYTNQIIVNHRVDLIKRKKQGKNYYRFQKQLQNTFFIFLNYYPQPAVSILKLLLHNLKKYALQDVMFFKLYCKALHYIFINYKKKKKFRKPIAITTIDKIRKVKSLTY